MYSSSFVIISNAGQKSYSAGPEAGSVNSYQSVLRYSLGLVAALGLLFDALLLPLLAGLLAAAQLCVAPDGLHCLNLPETCGQLSFAGLQQRGRPRSVPAQHLLHSFHPSGHYHLKTHRRELHIVDMGTYEAIHWLALLT